MATAMKRQRAILSFFTPPAKRTDSECDSQTSSSVQPLEAGSDSDDSRDNDESEPEVEAEVATGGDEHKASALRWSCFFIFV